MNDSTTQFEVFYFFLSASAARWRPTTKEVSRTLARRTPEDEKKGKYRLERTWAWQQPCFPYDTSLINVNFLLEVCTN
jgi:hypothetical protein